MAGLAFMTEDCPVCIKAMRLFEHFVNEKGTAFLYEGSVRFYFHSDGLRELLEADGRLPQSVLEDIGVDPLFYVDYKLGTMEPSFRLHWDDTLKPNEIVLRF